ncbi:MAG: carboxylating nicotinate-nucleotide diphosphorylase [Balneolaceae bacterium]|nr:MAG: carboxylating nicotinate-nucleotide diphosphorylase [Balneolaceae bacterium]
MEVFAVEWIDELIQRALEEDIGDGDVTTQAIVDAGKSAKAVWIAKQSGIIAGLNIAKRVFEHLDKNILWKSKLHDGDSITAGVVIAEIEGSCRTILTGERVALNFAQRMSGIATKTAEMNRILDGYPTKILDTRKTVPGLRLLDKAAVKAGGGTNHRMGLYDMAMIKDNHIHAAGSITVAIENVRSHNPGLKIEVETTSLAEVEEAVEAGAHIIMLDNMDIETMRKAVLLIGNRAKTEASGNIMADRIIEVAETGVDYISIGALTHSAAAFDISQQLTEMF